MCVKEGTVIQEGVYTFAYHPGSSHHETQESRSPADGHGGESGHAHAACKVHVGGVDPVPHVLRPDTEEREKRKERDRVRDMKGKKEKREETEVGI